MAVRRPHHHHRRLATIVSLAILGTLAVGAGAYRSNPALRRAGKILGYRLADNWTKPAASPTTVRLAVPYHRQEHSLSCEAAALTMVLGYFGERVSEADLIAQLPVADPGPRQPGNVWGDPDAGFVGDIDGRIPNGGYGVYEAPIVELASRYRSASALTGATLADLLAEVDAGRPVIVWGTLADGRDISWTTPQGKRVTAVAGEHTRVLIGFTGTLEQPRRLILHDPIYGTITMAKEKFLANWARLGNRAVVVY